MSVTSVKGTTDSGITYIVGIKDGIPQDKISYQMKPKSAYLDFTKSQLQEMLKIFEIADRLRPADHGDHPDCDQGMAEGEKKGFPA